ncbi:MAG: cobalamin-binding protein [Candidatus Omnitrophica bacterium]|nr:cobalamin-binding protein [Candidatus Omnitrophota bacterium]
MKRLLLIIALILLGAVPAIAKPRYVSLAPSTTEILFALGLDEEIVGVSSYCNYPQKAKSKTKVGDFSHPSIEKIVSLKPDYIFCTGLEQAPIVTSLKQLKFNVYVADPKNLQEVIDTIIEIGQITKREYNAQILAKQIQDEIEVMSVKTSAIPPEKQPKVFLEIWHDPLTTAGSGSYLDELVTAAGGINIANDTSRPYSIFSPEEVIKRNPDVMILTYMGGKKPGESVAKRFGWQEISAVKNNRIYNDIDPDLLLHPGPRVALAIKEINKRLYP